MRLLNVKTLCLEDFTDDDEGPPKYAILSHRWAKHEVSFAQLLKATPEEKEGFVKIRASARMAELAGLSYIWIDTCCIDKSSSAELQESINSMFWWYRRSEVCFAYLDDVIPGSMARTIMNSKWWTRGWTLQELIAPQEVRFYACDWGYLGSKRDFAEDILEATNIDKGTLSDPDNLRNVSIAKRMSWASRRVTTRKEDIAYCLLGIFGVHMTLLYGEKDNAFLRLQEEIMKQSTDQSLFAWFPSELSKQQRGTLTRCGLLAIHPSEFSNSGNIISTQERSSTYSITNQGLRISLPTTLNGMKNAYIGHLACYFEDKLEPVRIRLVWDPYTEDSLFFRDVAHPFDTGRFEDYREWYSCAQPRETHIAKFDTPLPSSILYSQIIVKDGRLYDLQVKQACTDSRGQYYYNGSIVQLRLENGHNIASVLCTFDGGVQYFLTYGLVGSDAYSAFVHIQLKDDNMELQTYHEHMVSHRANICKIACRKFAMYVTSDRGSRYKCTALVSWRQILNQRVLEIEVSALPVESLSFASSLMDSYVPLFLYPVIVGLLTTTMLEKVDEPKKIQIYKESTTVILKIGLLFMVLLMVLLMVQWLSLSPGISRRSWRAKFFDPWLCKFEPLLLIIFSIPFLWMMLPQVHRQ